MFFWKKKNPSPPPLAYASVPPQHEAAVTTAATPSSTPHKSGLSQVKTILAVASGKGGVGKSTITTNLAVALSQQGYRVGVLDADIYGPSQPSLLGQHKARAKGDQGHILPIESYGIKFVSMGVLLDDDGPVVWRAPMATKILHQFITNVQWGELDFLLIDLPPGTGDVHITLAQQAQIHGAIIVTTPQEVAVNIARKGLMMFEQVNVPILGLVENMAQFVCGHCGEATHVFPSHQKGIHKLATDSNTKVIGSIPMDPSLALAGDTGVPIIHHAPDSKSAASFIELAKNLLNVLSKSQEQLQNTRPQKTTLLETGELSIEWADGHHSIHSPYQLRLICPCANCVDENTGKRILKVESIPLDIRVVGASLVGQYGFSIRFSDQHGTGIYKFKALKEICECHVCSGKRQQEGAQTAAFQV